MSDRAGAWIAAMIVTLLLIILVAFGGSTRDARYGAMGVLKPRVTVTQSQIDARLQGVDIMHLLAVTQRR